MSLNRGERVRFPSTTGSGGRKDRVGNGKNEAGILCGACPLAWIHADSRAGTQKMAILPLHRVCSFWNFSSAFTCPVGERDSHCQLGIFKFAYEPFYQSVQAFSHHEVNRAGLSVYFQDAYETEKIKMWLIRNRNYTVRFSCSRLAQRSKHSL